jgi:hypothetical protein
MCFSAHASFIVAATLATCSALLAKKIRYHELRPLIWLPLLLGLQQALEGFVWITINNGDVTSIWHHAAVYGFLFFASILWPVYIPWALCVAEPHDKRIQQLRRTFMLGLLVSSIALCAMLFIGFKAEAIGHRIVYSFLSTPPSIDILYIILLTCYTAAISGAFFISSIPYMWILGTLIFLSLFVIKIINALAFGSLWCFSGAVGSLSLYFILSNYAAIKSKYDLPDA